MAAGGVGVQFGGFAGGLPGQKERGTGGGYRVVVGVEEESGRGVLGDLDLGGIFAAGVDGAHEVRPVGGSVIERGLNSHVTAGGKAHDADLGGIEAPFRRVLAHDFDGAESVGGGHGTNLGLGSESAGAASGVGSGSPAAGACGSGSGAAGGGAGLGLGELLVGSGVGEAVLEDESSHAVALEPVGHQGAFQFPGEHAESAARRHYHGGSGGGFGRGKVDRDTRLDDVAHGFEAGSGHGVLGFFPGPVLGAGGAVGPEHDDVRLRR